MSGAASADKVLQLGEGEESAPERDRLQFLVTLVQSSCALLESCDNEKAKKNVRRRLGGVLGEAVKFLWEAPKQTKYSAGRKHSTKARGFADLPRVEKPKHLRYDHSIPLRMVIDDLLGAHGRPRRIKSILLQVEACLITLEEEKALNRRYRDRLPEGPILTSRIGARYAAANIKFPIC
jgi:hypothetical protein